MDEDASLRSTVSACNLQPADLPAGARLVVDRLHGLEATAAAHMPAAQRHMLAQSERGFRVSPQPQYLLVHSFVLLYVDSAVAQADALRVAGNCGLATAASVQAALSLSLSVEHAAWRVHATARSASVYFQARHGAFVALLIVRGMQEFDPQGLTRRLAALVADRILQVSHS